MPIPQILIVEDDPIIAADLGDHVMEMGYEIFASVDNGEEALSIIKESQPSLVLMDVQLAGALDGIDTANQMMAEHSFPIIFLTSNTDERTFGRARSSQPKAFLSKPFRRRDLKHGIELALSQYEKNSVQQAVAEPITQQLDDRIFIKSKDLMVKILLKDILWVVADNYYCEVVTTDKKHLATITLKKFDEQVNADFLMRIHRSYIVNLNRIDKVGGVFVYVGPHKIPLGKSYSAALQERLNLL